MANEGEEREARVERLIPLLDHLRSYLGMVALLAIGLPAVVLVLTLLADSSRPLPTQASDDGVESGNVAHQARSEGRRSGGSGEEEKVRPLGQRDEDGTPERNAGADRTDPTRQIVRDQEGADGGQDPPNAALDAPATLTATAAPASTAEPAPLSASTTPGATATASATAPATTSAAPASADAAATANPEPASAPEPSAPANVTPISEPVEVPADGVRGAVSDPQLYGAPE